MNKSVKEYIDKQEEPKKTLLRYLRNLLFENIADCKEEFKWGVPVYDGNKFYIAAMKTRVHIGFAISGLSKNEIEKFEGTGKTMRHVKIHSLDDMQEKELVTLIKMVHQKANSV